MLLAGCGWPGAIGPVTALNDGHWQRFKRRMPSVASGKTADWAEPRACTPPAAHSPPARHRACAVATRNCAPASKKDPPPVLGSTNRKQKRPAAGTREYQPQAKKIRRRYSGVPTASKKDPPPVLGSTNRKQIRPAAGTREYQPQANLGCSQAKKIRARYCRVPTATGFRLPAPQAHPTATAIRPRWSLAPRAAPAGPGAQSLSTAPPWPARRRACPAGCLRTRRHA